MQKHIDWNPERMPPTGLDGTYSGTCVGCLRATDTALGVRGSPSWHAAALVLFGVPEDQAIGMTEMYLDRVGTATEGHPGWTDIACRVCSDCAGRSGRLPAPVLVVAGTALPTLVQPITVDSQQDLGDF